MIFEDDIIDFIVKVIFWIVVVAILAANVVVIICIMHDYIYKGEILMGIGMSSLYLIIGGIISAVIIRLAASWLF